jgi:hypothetical protein
LKVAALGFFSRFGTIAHTAKRSMRGLALCVAAMAKAPDTSLTTTPVMYYGANWNRTQLNIDVLAKMQMVVLMQEDGHCWQTCCPKRFDHGSQCGWQLGDPDATTYKGCDAACEEHGSQGSFIWHILY